MSNSDDLQTNEQEEREADAYADDALLRALEEEYGIEGDFTVSTVTCGSRSQL